MAEGGYTTSAMIWTSVGADDTVQDRGFRFEQRDTGPTRYVWRGIAATAGDPAP